MTANNVFGLSFYAIYDNQLQSRFADVFGKVEATIFNREDLMGAAWDSVWTNTRQAVELFGGCNTSFHFPVNNSNIVTDPFVRSRLIETLKRSEELGIPNVVIHANQLYLLEECKHQNWTELRSRYLDCLQEVIYQAGSNVSVNLENLPPIGNLYDDADPVFIFTEDFQEIDIQNVGITWDICHYFNTVYTMHYASNDPVFRDMLPSYQPCDYMDFTRIISKIKHWHFSAFDQMANPLTETICREGVLPVESCVEESMYQKALRLIYEDAVKSNKAIIFEIAEKDYTHRYYVLQMLEWAQKVVKEHSFL
ncbi:sugar phosphate isomerase/epimerase family protein [Paenibacillus sp. TC-CSREp1]|uniref:sugar phosphate isomerase/epimerase family protein n=1 Tax=Paenibacillus sp. TC-CSREp1 TaxID=3410089 RepID=UPI003CEC9AC0